MNLEVIQLAVARLPETGDYFSLYIMYHVDQTTYGDSSEGRGGIQGTLHLQTEEIAHR